MNTCPNTLNSSHKPLNKLDFLFSCGICSGVRDPAAFSQTQWLPWHLSSSHSSSAASFEAASRRARTASRTSTGQALGGRWQPNYLSERCWSGAWVQGHNAKHVEAHALQVPCHCLGHIHAERVPAQDHLETSARTVEDMDDMEGMENPRRALSSNAAGAAKRKASSTDAHRTAGTCKEHAGHVSIRLGNSCLSHCSQEQDKGSIPSVPFVCILSWQSCFRRCLDPGPAKTPCATQWRSMPKDQA
ncbi:unnamed protein product [Symbiodinium natans]|uniref:Uncharacterized protein n=1 Tax=Symbiodinium natans TaxID=878477 RepID=A0A812H4E1_9DINO|nr:unnamed protein product [Symbiodinium natans]